MTMDTVYSCHMHLLMNLIIVQPHMRLMAEYCGYMQQGLQIMHHFGWMCFLPQKEQIIRQKYNG